MKDCRRSWKKFTVRKAKAEELVDRRFLDEMKTCRITLAE